MRGMLMHVEHLVTLGMVGDISREHRAIISPSNEALLLAFSRSGPDVRQAVAFSWKLESLLLRREDDGDTLDYAALRAAIVAKWLRQPLPAIDGITEEKLAALLAEVAPRVAEAAEANRAAAGYDKDAVQKPVTVPIRPS
jgi:hypothetical protein